MLSNNNARQQLYRQAAAVWILRVQTISRNRPEAERELQIQGGPPSKRHDLVVADVHDPFCRYRGPASAPSPYCSLLSRERFLPAGPPSRVTEFSKPERIAL